MADFEQSAAARQAMQDSARDALYNRILSGSSKAQAGALGVSQRQVQRYRAFIKNERGQSAPAQRKNPVRALPKVAAQGQARLTFRGTVYVGGNPKYKRQLNMSVDVPKETLTDALNDPDAAWQAFNDAYVMPDSEVVEIHDLHFEI